MIHLALTIASALFLTGVAATVAWVTVYVIGLIVLGTWECIKVVSKKSFWTD